MYTFIGAPNPTPNVTLNLPTSKQYETRSRFLKKKVQSQVLIAKTVHKQAVYKHYKQVMLHSKFSEAIQCLYVKKRVKQGFNR